MTQQMKAAIYQNYGPPEVLEIVDVVKPIPKSNEVLVKIHVATVTSADSRVRSLNTPVGFGLLTRLVFGIFKPRQPILGSEFSGVIEAIGKDVRNFKIGDSVFGISDIGMRSYAEFKCIAEDGALVLKPATLTFEQAAALSFGGTTAIEFLRKAKLKQGDEILVNGASGAVGLAVVQLAKEQGAIVTAVCSSANNELVKSLRADYVIDYTTDDFTRNGKRYDVIVDTAGTAPYSRSKRSLNAQGKLLMILADLPSMLIIPWVHLTTRKRVVATPATARAKDLIELVRLVQAKAFVVVIDRTYPFSDIVNAHRYVDTGRKRGNVILQLVQ
jgi:NADPH:quinone reductase-like Zn-dependent oxidoreductase